MDEEARSRGRQKKTAAIKAMTRARPPSDAPKIRPRLDEGELVSLGGTREGDADGRGGKGEGEGDAGGEGGEGGRTPDSDGELKYKSVPSEVQVDKPGPEKKRLCLDAPPHLQLLIKRG